MVPEPCKMQLLTSKNRASDLALGIPACLSLSIFMCGSLYPRGGLTLGLGRMPSVQFISLSLRPSPWSLCRGQKSFFAKQQVSHLCQESPQVTPARGRQASSPRPGGPTFAPRSFVIDF